MKLADIILAIREFFLEFLGYLLPGTIFLLLFGYFLEDQAQTSLIANFPETNRLYLFLAIAYVLGYALYGISILKDKVIKYYNKLAMKVEHLFLPPAKFPKRDKPPFPRWLFRHLRIEDKIQVVMKIRHTREYQITVDILKKHIDFPSDKMFSEKKAGEFAFVRNLALSFIPESDIKVATFVLRSELANFTSTSLLLIGSCGIVNSLIPANPLKLNGDPFYLYLYMLLLIAAYLLHITYMRFLKISKKIVFPIFIAKYYAIRHELEKD